ncbi:YuzF family protein [Bacillus thuringiensis]|uniref:YuzF family protein n=1 Tax=Bacillus thuringiensis TaxID=1428 RepID=UPI000D652683|nr:YuzF family protein [Bacillus thuringiensis]MBD8076817.1 YuzF family protein [Bacillus thuringiensis]
MSYSKGNDLSEQHMVSTPNPYVYQTLQSVIGKHVVIETVRGNVRGNVRGKLKDVKPDHLLIEDTAPYIVRIQQIVWIMPKQ